MESNIASREPFVLVDGFTGEISNVRIPLPGGDSVYVERFVSGTCWNVECSTIPEPFRSSAASPLVFRNADLQYLRCSRLDESYLNCATFQSCNLSYANFCGSRLRTIRFDNCNLTGADFSDSQLHGCDFSSSDLTRASLVRAQLDQCNLSRCRCLQTRLANAGTRCVNFSGASGLFSPVEFMRENFYSDRYGYYVWKRLSVSSSRRRTAFHPPSTWDLTTPGVPLTETVDRNPYEECGSGVNFATYSWCFGEYREANLWLCLLPWRYLPELVVPFNTDGKARCSYLLKLRNYGCAMFDIPETRDQWLEVTRELEQKDVYKALA